jgi:hypothetical protein
MDGAQQREIAAINGRAWLAWHIAGLQRTTPLPDLSDMMIGAKGQHQSSTAQDLVFGDLFLAWGGDPDVLTEICEPPDPSPQLPKET